MAFHLTQGRFNLYPHIDFLDDKIVAALAKGGARLVVAMPPRHGKSWLISRFLPAWYLSIFPERNVILSSYEANFAASWGRQARNFIQEHQSALNVEIADDSHASDRWNTAQGGGMITAGVGGAITGRGGDLIIVDDPVKNWEEAESPTYRQRSIDWWNSTLYTRAEPGASIIVLATRWHQRDLSGYLLSEENETYKDWTDIRIPAIAEAHDPLGRKIGEALCRERYDEAALDKIRKSVGSRVWNALYQQRPSAEEGNIIKREWVKRYSQHPQFEEVIISVDATFTGKSTSDYVAMQVWGRWGVQKYLLDQVHDRLGITETIDALAALASRHPRATLKLIENKANGPAIEDLLKHKMSGIVLWEPKGDKVSRVHAIAPQFEAGNVFIPYASWADSFLEELVTFPNAAHDDRTDACSMALIRLEEFGGHAGLIRVVRR